MAKDDAVTPKANPKHDPILRAPLKTKSTLGAELNTYTFHRHRTLRKKKKLAAGVGEKCDAGLSKVRGLGF